MVKVVCSDIVADELLEKANAIVNACNPFMTNGSGVNGAIFKKAGAKDLLRYCKKNFSEVMQTGEVRITPGFNIPCDIMFCMSPKKYIYASEDDAMQALVSAYRNVLAKAMEKGYKTILLPSLGAGTYGFDHKLIAKSVMALLQEEAYKDLDIIFVNYDKVACEAYSAQLK